MKQNYYEVHITFECKDKETAKKVINANKWIFSSIDNDITLGQGIKCYATRHFNKRKSVDYVKDCIIDMDYLLVKDANVKVLRHKIELVIYDKKLINQ